MRLTPIKSESEVKTRLQSVVIQGFDNSSTNSNNEALPLFAQLLNESEIIKGLEKQNLLDGAYCMILFKCARKPDNATELYEPKLYAPLLYKLAEQGSKYTENPRLTGAVGTFLREYKEQIPTPEDPSFKGFLLHTVQSNPYTSLEQKAELRKNIEEFCAGKHTESSISASAANISNVKSPPDTLSSLGGKEIPKGGAKSSLTHNH